MLDHIAVPVQRLAQIKRHALQQFRDRCKFDRGQSSKETISDLCLIGRNDNSSSACGGSASVSQVTVRPTGTAATSTMPEFIKRANAACNESLAHDISEAIIQRLSALRSTRCVSAGSGDHVVMIPQRGAQQTRAPRVRRSDGEPLRQSCNLCAMKRQISLSQIGQGPLLLLEEHDTGR